MRRVSRLLVFSFFSSSLPPFDPFNRSATLTMKFYIIGYGGKKPAYVTKEIKL